MNYSSARKLVLLALTLIFAAIAGCDSDESRLVVIVITASPTPIPSARPSLSPSPALSPTPSVIPSATATAVASASPTTAPTATATGTTVPTSTATPSSTAAHGGVFVSDAGNFRVHIFLPPISDGKDADIAIGQSGLDEFEASDPTQDTVGFPVDATFDGAGNLWIADLANSRVLRFPAPFSTGMKADLVLGQSNFLSGGPSLNERSFNNPLAVAVDSSGDVFVADAGNSRILEFVPPLASGMPASVAIGQANLLSGVTQSTRSGLNVPTGIAFDPSGNLWVADNNNNRVLEFVPPFSSGMDASLVLGQADFTANLAPAPGPNSMNAPYAVAVAGSGELYVADGNNNRVLIFKPPLSNGMDASIVIGQPDLVHGASGTSDKQLSLPQGIGLDGGGNLWVADTSNNRVLEFVPPFTNGMSASRVIGQLGFSTGEEGDEAGDLALPLGVAVKP